MTTLPTLCNYGKTLSREVPEVARNANFVLLVIEANWNQYVNNHVF